MQSDPDIDALVVAHGPVESLASEKLKPSNSCTCAFGRVACLERAEGERSELAKPLQTSNQPAQQHSPRRQSSAFLDTFIA